MPRQTRWHALPLIALLALLAACSSNPGAISNQEPPSCDAEALAPGDPAIGEALFRRTLQQSGGRAPTCATCHVVRPDEPEIVGPGIHGIASSAANRLQEQSAREYLCTSIIAPNDYIVPGYNAGIMPRIYGLYLSQEQVNDLVAYMLTLEE
jgi:mono/diheme cytochrome c family protein